MKKNGVICVVFMLPSWVMILKLSKKCIFSILCWPQQKNLSMLKQFNTYMNLKGLVTHFWRYQCLKSKNSHFCWVSIVFDILISNISWTVAQTPIKHIIFWKTLIRTFISIYVNCFNRLRFLAEVSTKLQKIHFMDNLRGISQEGSMKTRQMTPFFIYVFLKLCLAFIFIFQNGRNSFSCGHPFGLFWSVKYLNFGQKLPNRTAHHTFLESRHPVVT